MSLILRHGFRRVEMIGCHVRHVLRQTDGLALLVSFFVLYASRVPIHLGYMRDPCRLFQMYGASLA